jgi:hypothetical protein
MMDETLYVVSGFMRTGSSMMMKALETGGMDTEYKQSRDEMKDHFADEHYDPNIGGLYELERQDYRAFGFPRKYKGKLIKALNTGIPRMTVMSSGIRVVFMRRDPEEIRQSYDAFFNKQLQNINHIERTMDLIIEQIKNRKDVISMDVFWYREVVNNPSYYFQLLRNHGWPIDIDKAASVIDPKYCRFKKENLTIGVL